MIVSLFDIFDRMTPGMQSKMERIRFWRKQQSLPIYSIHNSFKHSFTFPNGAPTVNFVNAGAPSAPIAYFREAAPLPMVCISRLGRRIMSLSSNYYQYSLKCTHVVATDVTYDIATNTLTIHCYRIPEALHKALSIETANTLLQRKYKLFCLNVVTALVREDALLHVPSRDANGDLQNPINTAPITSDKHSCEDFAQFATDMLIDELIASITSKKCLGVGIASHNGNISINLIIPVVFNPDYTSSYSGPVKDISTCSLPELEQTFKHHSLARDEWTAVLHTVKSSIVGFCSTIIYGFRFMSTPIGAITVHPHYPLALRPKPDYSLQPDDAISDYSSGPELVESTTFSNRSSVIEADRRAEDSDEGDVSIGTGLFELPQYPATVQSDDEDGPRSGIYQEPLNPIRYSFTRSGA